MVVDSSILIQFLRAKQKSETLLWHMKEKRGPVMMVSAVTVYELFFGATDPGKQADVEKLIKPLPILPFDASAAQKAAEIGQILKKQNQQIGTRDLYIAATALLHNLPIFTLNRKHFDRVPGLKVENSV